MDSRRFRATGRRLAFPPVLCLALLQTVQPLDAATRIAGVVVDPHGTPISGAVVRLQTTQLSDISDPSGRFELIIDAPVDATLVTAWKAGFYNGGQAIPAGGVDACISLTPIPPGDNQNYQWLPPLASEGAASPGNPPKIRPCADCHPDLAKQWKESAHGRAAANPVFLAFYGGAEDESPAGAGPVYKSDFPDSAGNCALCHAPAAALANPFGSDPRDARGPAAEGVFCDLCHKINAVDVDPSGGRPGILSIGFSRPASPHQIFYGPYDDVVPGDDSFHPLYKESRVCAPCHEGTFWNVPMYSEFSEWRESSYAARGVQCQGCHMKPDATPTRFALEREGGRVRDPATIPTHRFDGIRDRDFMAKAIHLGVEGASKGDAISVAVTVRNVNAGHHVPTGNPMRNMILLVDAVDDQGNRLPLARGERVPSWGGVGPVAEGNYAGLPGKGFAKVLRDAMPYPDGRGPRHLVRAYPAPHWRPAVIESDTRIPADGLDASLYEFSVPADWRGSIRISTTLIYRGAYKAWMDAKGLPLEPIELARKSMTIRRSP